MSRALLILSDETIRAKAMGWVRNAPLGSRIEFKRPKRSVDQNSLMWKLLTEVSSQVTHHDLRLSTDDWKVLFLDALKREVRMVPSLGGNGIVSLGRSSSDLSKEEMSDLIELIYAYGAEHDVVFHDAIPQAVAA